ncbi:MAG: ATP phosphoribosyltransferase regulatory subunit [Hyphomonadaceae bacterium]|nr:ATP phosphoribosyltransferase regulatory subunit [Hyphomonadaceae bacterium]
MTGAANALRRAVTGLGGRWIDPPVLQPAGLYLELAGEDLRQRAFLIAGDEDALCLRPDMTAPAVRVALKDADWGAPFAVAYDGLVFRRQNDPARETEFRQIGVECFGPRAALDAREAEVTIAAWEAARSAGAAPTLRLGDVAVFEALVESCALAEAWSRRFKRAFARPGGLSAALAAAALDSPQTRHPLGQALAAMPEAEAETAVAAMLADARIPVVGGRSVAEIAQRLRDKGGAAAAPPPDKAALAAIVEAVGVQAQPDAAFAALRSIAARLAAPQPLEAAIERAAQRWAAVKGADAPEATFSVGFGRGLAYYDGFVFELEAPTLGARASLGGGGRYDGLLHRVAISEGGGPAGAETWGAIGFALRPQRIDEAAA